MLALLRGMTKRKAEDVHDLSIIVKRFDTFVESLASLLKVTPEDNFPVKGVDNGIEDRVVIAKVLKRMRVKGQLSWMDQYLKDKDARAPSPFETASFRDPAFQTLSFAKISAQVLPTRDGQETYPALPPVYNQALLNQAFTHRSYATACAPPTATKDLLTTLHYERLEFLGDSFLNHSVTKMLFSQMPQAREGEMSLLRAELIGNATAAEFGRHYGFDKQLLLNETAERDGVRSAQKVLADTFEAYLGAMILDGPDGVVRADNWLKALMAPRIKNYFETKNDEPLDVMAKQKLWNHFSRISPQHVTDPDGVIRPVVKIDYQWIDGEGLNDDRFVVVAKMSDSIRGIYEQELGRGVGRRKKDAEHRAAMDSLRTLGL